MEIGDAELEIALDTSGLVWKGIVTLPIENGIKVAVFNAQELEENIVWPGLSAKPTTYLSPSSFDLTTPVSCSSLVLTMWCPSIR